MKRIRFWGTRGSLPVALAGEQVRRKLVAALRGSSGRAFGSDAEIEQYVAGLPFDVAGTYGGNSSCVEIETGGPEFVICDLGSGARAFGNAALARRREHGPQSFHVFLSHLHWDHIMGLPFFVPAYVPGNRVTIYGGHANIEAALRRQMDQPSFPVGFDTFRATFAFVQLEPGRRHNVAGMTVTPKLQFHGGDSYGYRFEAEGKSVVYSTDSEHKLDDVAEHEAFVAFFEGADVVIFDAMYSLADAISIKSDWGHSSNVVGVEMCQLARAKHLCLFHHEPALDDAAIERVLAETRRLEEITRDGEPMIVSAAFDGMEIAL